MKTAVRRTLIALVILAVAAGIALALWPEPTGVDAATVSVGPMLLTIDEEGMTRLRDRYTVSSPLAGRLHRVTLDPGDPVQAGATTLALLAPTPPALLDPRQVAQAQARVHAAEAALRRAEAVVAGAVVDHDFAQAELTRVSDATRAGAGSARELDQATARQRAAAQALHAAHAEHDVARFELDLARSALLYARAEPPDGRDALMPLTSPIDGLVLRVFQESAAVVNPGDPLLEIGDPADLELVIDVLSTDAVRITPGDRVILDHWGGDEPLEARVRLVEPSAYTHVSALGIEEQRVDVVADFVTPRHQRPSLGDRFRVDARIVIWSEDAALRVPTSAVFQDRDSRAVFVIDAGRARTRHVEIGRRTPRWTQVLSGLSAGQPVVLHPGDQLEDGSRVRVRQAGAQ